MAREAVGSLYRDALVGVKLERGKKVYFVDLFEVSEVVVRNSAVSLVNDYCYTVFLSFFFAEIYTVKLLLRILNLKI